MIGVIGGMGPLATADFMQKVIAATSAEHDEQHVPLLISSDPRIPRRPAALLDGGESPLPRLIEIRDRLIVAGATALVMPCNTAHYWHCELVAGTSVPFPSIVEVTCDAVVSKTRDHDRVGLVATQATLVTGLFQDALDRRHRTTVSPSDEITRQCMLPAIALVKAGKVSQASELMRETVEHLLQMGVTSVILACTEAPIAMSLFPELVDQYCIDSTEALAVATVQLWDQQKSLDASV